MRGLGNLVHEARIAQGLTLRKFGEKAGFEAMFISQVENSKRIPQRQATLEALARAAGISYDTIKNAAVYSKMESEMVDNNKAGEMKAKVALARTLAETEVTPEMIEKIMQVLRKEA